MSEVLELQIRPGMSERTDPRLLPVVNGEATPRLIQNYRARQFGRLEKRPGTLSKGTTGLPSAGYAGWVGEVGGTAAIGITESATTSQDDNSIYYNTGSRWEYMGRHSHCVPHRRFTVMGGTQTAETKDPSVIAVNGLLYVCYADEGGGTTIINIIEITPEGTQLRIATTTAGGTHPRIIWTGAAFYLISTDATAIEVRELNLTTFSLGAATTLSTAAVSGTTCDVSLLVGSTEWLICYATAANTLRVIRMTGVVETDFATVTTTGGLGPSSVRGVSGAEVFVIYHDGAAVQLTIFDVNLANPNEITVHTAAGDETLLFQPLLVRVGTSSYAVFLSGTEVLGNGTTLFTYNARVNAAGTLTMSPQKVWHFAPAAKPMTVGDLGQVTPYLWLGNGAGFWDDHLQARHILAAMEDVPSTGGGAQLASVSYEHQAYSLNTFIGDTASLGDGRFAAILPWRDFGKFTGLDCAVFSLTTPDVSMSKAHRQTLEAGGALFVSGGCLTDIADAPSDDSFMAPENGFAYAPLISLDTDSGGSLTADQEYTYAAVFRRIDGRGRVQRSAAAAKVAEPVTVTPTGSDLTVDVTISTLAISNRWGLQGQSVVAEVYRSWLGGPFYYVGSIAVPPNASSVELSDGNADADIIDDDGALDIAASQPELPSGARLICQWGPRLACVGWEENVVQLSKFYRADTSWEFVDEEDWELDVREPITALGYMDGAGVIFTARGIYICTGDGPTDDGRGGAFDQPRPLPAAVGADSPHVVEGQAGLFFKGGGTIYLLPRGFGPPQPVGDDVKETLASFPYLRAAVRCTNADDDCTHFVVAQGDTFGTATQVLVWNNRLNTWMLDSISGAIGAAGSVSGVFTWLLAEWDSAADIPARKFSTASFEDLTGNGASAWIESRVTFGDFRPFGAIGWGNLEKIAMVGEIAGDFTLSLSVTADRQAIYTVTKELTTEGQFFMEHGLPYPQGCFFTVSIFDAAISSGRTSGLVLHALGLEVAKAPGLRRVDAGTAERIT